MNRPLKALVLGGRTGLLGQALAATLSAKGWEVHCPSRGEIDLFGQAAVTSYLERMEIAFLFNTVAYTQVDRAEEERNEAFRLNRSLPVMLGRSAAAAGTVLVHYSTDFVFDGRKDVPYTETDEPNPQSVYGKSKLAGERALLELDLPGLLILRTAWLFGPGKINFVDRIIELAREREQLNVVHDQVGSPTFTEDLAQHSLNLVTAGARGIFHVVDTGKASWCELASETVSCMGLSCRIQAIATKDYPQKAKRPPYSVLETSALAAATGRAPRPWVKALRSYLFCKGEEERGD
jgi:dTDP-4-dehydrorhamnose reductase